MNGPNMTTDLRRLLSLRMCPFKGTNTGHQWHLAQCPAWETKESRSALSAHGVIAQQRHLHLTARMLIGTSWREAKSKSHGMRARMRLDLPLEQPLTNDELADRSSRLRSCLHDSSKRTMLLPPTQKRVFPARCAIRGTLDHLLYSISKSWSTSQRDPPCATLFCLRQR